MSKKLNIIEAMKMPIGSIFEVEFDGKKIMYNKMKIYKTLVCDRETKHMDWQYHPKDTFIKPYDYLINATFIPIQQPVSFMETVAKAKTNRFRIEHELLPKSSFGHTLRGTLHILINELELSNNQIADIIQNGKCYIEESEDDSNE